MNFEKIKTLSFLEFVPLCPLMLVKRSKNLLYIDTTEWYSPFRHFLIASACTFHVETSRRQAKFDHLTPIKAPLGVTRVSKVGLTMYTWLFGMTSNHSFIVQSHSSSLVTLKMLESRAPLLAAKAWHLPAKKELIILFQMAPTRSLYDQ